MYGRGLNICTSICIMCTSIFTILFHYSDKLDLKFPIKKLYTRKIKDQMVVMSKCHGSQKMNVPIFNGFNGC